MGGKQSEVHGIKKCRWGFGCFVQVDERAAERGLRLRLRTRSDDVDGADTQQFIGSLAQAQATPFDGPVPGSALRPVFPSSIETTLHTVQCPRSAKVLITWKCRGTAAAPLAAFKLPRLQQCERCNNTMMSGSLISRFLIRAFLARRLQIYLPIIHRHEPSPLNGAPENLGCRTFT